jgi:LacI family transcriptional regulator, galactose operon repressor
MTSPVTQKDIALALGLSVSTIARSLAGSPRIGKATRERVRAEAETRGYIVDEAARSMRQGTSSLVGLIAPDLQNDFYTTVARAVTERCR